MKNYFIFLRLRFVLSSMRWHGGRGLQSWFFLIPYPTSNYRKTFNNLQLTIDEISKS